MFTSRSIWFVSGGDEQETSPLWGFVKAPATVYNPNYLHGCSLHFLSSEMRQRHCLKCITCEMPAIISMCTLNIKSNRYRSKTRNHHYLKYRKDISCSFIAFMHDVHHNTQLQNCVTLLYSCIDFSPLGKLNFFTQLDCYNILPFPFGGKRGTVYGMKRSLKESMILTLYDKFISQNFELMCVPVLQIL